MYGILAYETWRIFDGEDEIGLVSLNGPDNYVKFSAFEGFEPWVAYYADRSFGWWMQWIRRHRRDKP